jgi:hypothetical protein
LVLPLTQFRQFNNKPIHCTNWFALLAALC